MFSLMHFLFFHGNISDILPKLYRGSQGVIRVLIHFSNPKNLQEWNEKITKNDESSHLLGRRATGRGCTAADTRDYRRIGSRSSTQTEEDRQTESETYIYIIICIICIRVKEENQRSLKRKTRSISSVFL